LPARSLSRIVASANVRICVSYTTSLRLYGGTTNFDGFGHNAKDNNTLFLDAWAAL
jgi:hypothetical protein